MSDFVLQYDASCDGCGYNLRGLSTSGACPECGLGVMFGHAADTEERSGLGRLVQCRPFTDVAHTSGYPLDAILFVQDVLQQAAGGAASGRPPRDGHLRAADLIVAFADHCGRYFNDADEARDLLSEWRLTTSEDVGRVVFALAASGSLDVRPDDRLADFDGLFTLATLFDRPA